MKKFLIAAAIAAITTVSLSAPSQARYRNHGNNTGVVVKIHASNEDHSCLVKKIRMTDRHGKPFFRLATVCN